MGSVIVAQRCSSSAASMCSATGTAAGDGADAGTYSGEYILETAETSAIRVS
eukprot:COSAG06_NODE_1813_length_8305_cov_5.110407_17_plen_52_part_00